MPALHNAWRIVCRLIPRSDGPAMRTNSGRLREAWDWLGQYARDTQQQEELARQDELRTARRAGRRGLTLLLRVMNPEQRQEFRKFRHFHVVGGHSGNRYRIRDGVLANIDVLSPDGTVAYRLCVHPAGTVPVYDVMAAQLLHLQYSGTEQQFVQQAIIHPLPRPRSACTA